MQNPWVSNRMTQNILFVSSDAASSIASDVVVVVGLCSLVSPFILPRPTTYFLRYIHLLYYCLMNFLLNTTCIVRIALPSHSRRMRFLSRFFCKLVFSAVYVLLTFRAASSLHCMLSFHCVWGSRVLYIFNFGVCIVKSLQDCLYYVFRVYLTLLLSVRVCFTFFMYQLRQVSEEKRKIRVMKRMSTTIAWRRDFVTSH